MIIQQIVDFLISLPNFQDIGLFLVFIFALLPLSPIPSEGIIIPLLAISEQQDIEYLRMQLITYMVILGQSGWP